MLDQLAVSEKVAMIAGTSACLMAFDQKPRYVKGVWGPYFGVVFPDLYLNEAGMSETSRFKLS